MLMGFFFVILIVCLAMMMSEGLWSNAISAINVTLAAMVATNWYEILADYLNSQAPSYTYVWDFLMLWALFALSFTVFRAFTDQISKHRVRFKMPVEIAGRIIFALLTGWIFICFTNMTLHTAPLARTAFRGSFSAEPKSKASWDWLPTDCGSASCRAAHGAFFPHPAKPDHPIRPIRTRTSSIHELTLSTNTASGEIPSTNT